MKSLKSLLTFLALDSNPTSISFDIDDTIGNWTDHAKVVNPDLPGFYASIPPIEGGLGLERVKEALTLGVPVYIITLAKYDWAYQEKREWLQRYLPEIPDENIFILPMRADKSEPIRKLKGGSLAKTDVLFDDYRMNMNNWHVAGGTPIGVNIIGISKTDGYREITSWKLEDK